MPFGKISWLPGNFHPWSSKSRYSNIKWHENLDQLCISSLSGIARLRWSHFRLWKIILLYSYIMRPFRDFLQPVSPHLLPQQPLQISLLQHLLLHFPYFTIFALVLQAFTYLHVKMIIEEQFLLFESCQLICCFPFCRELINFQELSFNPLLYLGYLYPFFC